MYRRLKRNHTKKILLILEAEELNKGKEKDGK